MEIYVVKQGDTVDSISLTQGSSVSSIFFNNQLTYPYALARFFYYLRAKPLSPRTLQVLTAMLIPLLNNLCLKKHFLI